MLNTDQVVPRDQMKVIDYAQAHVEQSMANGVVNTSADQILSNIKASIRRGLPQMRKWDARYDRICLVGSGPSLADTEDELRDLLWGGATLVTVNGAYHWCRDRNLRPETQIVMDARASNARFVQPYTPKCKYVLASQCHPDVFDAVADYPDVWIFHAVQKGKEDASAILDAYYKGQWFGVGGGTTVASRAIGLLRQAGYLRFDLFGIDCCWRGDRHHVLDQPENATDKRVRMIYSATDDPTTAKTFTLSPWHLKQFEDFLQLFKVNGQAVRVQVHGDGLLAYAMQTLGGDYQIVEE